MRVLRALCCALAVTACVAPAARADEYTKQTFLTFSGPVQLPGVTLAAGTYQFRLADPETGRRAIQVWDKEGTKLYTTLLTIPDQRMKVSDTPVVMFNERPSGEAQAIRSWFYPEESYGFEFIYPKQQATKIAMENHSPVLAFDDDKAEPSQFKSAKVGRVDENGRMTDADRPAAADASNAAQTAPASTTPAASDRPSSASSATTAQNDTTAAARMPEQSNTTVGTGGTPARSDAAVGTSGTTAGSAAAGGNAQPSNNRSMRMARANQADRGANAGSNSSGRSALPRTAGSTTMVELLGALALGAAATIRSLRARFAESR